MESFFENIKTAVKKAGRTVSDKAREVTQSAKLSAEINGAKANMENAFAELGKKYYSISGSNPDPELAELCSKIDDFKKAIAEKELELKKVKGERICHECGKTVTDKTAAFCPFCGMKMEEGAGEGQANDQATETEETVVQDEVGESAKEDSTSKE